jgi:hypothetical protein
MNSTMPGKSQKQRGVQNKRQLTVQRNWDEAIGGMGMELHVVSRKLQCERFQFRIST